MVKEKPNSTRIYDEEGFRRRAACICVRSEDETEVIIRRRPFVLVTESACSAKNVMCTRIAVARRVCGRERGRRGVQQLCWSAAGCRGLSANCLSASEAAKSKFAPGAPFFENPEVRVRLKVMTFCCGALSVYVMGEC